MLGNLASAESFLIMLSNLAWAETFLIMLRKLVKTVENLGAAW
jgi:hypothetical protein